MSCQGAFLAVYLDCVLSPFPFRRKRHTRGVDHSSKCLDESLMLPGAACLSLLPRSCEKHRQRVRFMDTCDYSSAVQLQALWLRDTRTQQLGSHRKFLATKEVPSQVPTAPRKGGGKPVESLKYDKRNSALCRAAQYCSTANFLPYRRGCSATNQELAACPKGCPGCPVCFLDRLPTAR